MPAGTTTTTTPPKLDPIITKPKPGLTYNPVTAESLARLQAEWEKMSPEARAAATRNQAAAAAAAQRAADRAEREKAMRDAKTEALRARKAEALALQRRQEKEAIQERKLYNKETTQRQQMRLAAAANQRAAAQRKLTTQRANEARATAKAKSDRKTRDAILARNRQIEQRNAAAAAKTAATNRTKAITSGRTNALQEATDYFGRQGVTDVSPYRGAIQKEIERLIGGLNPTEMPAQDLLRNVGEDVFNTLQGQQRGKASAQLKPYFDTGFEDQLLPDSSIDTTLGSIRDQQFADAQEYIDNMLSRGVITQPGYNKALDSLKGQIGQVNVQLQDIGKDILAGGRQSLTDIGNKAGTQAGNLSLGQVFNPMPFKSQLSEAVKKFQTNLPGQVQTQLQGNSLFDTSKLANIAGKAMGSQNTVFDPYALSNTAKPAQPLFDSRVGMKSVF